jgi:hypothetical protein
MQWTKERTGWLGTYREKRGSWHGVPYAVRVNTTRGMTRTGWIVAVATALIVFALVLVVKLLT